MEETTRCYGCMKPIAPGAVCQHCGYDPRQGNAPHQLPAGTVLKEQYLIGRVLGQGGFGITYLGWDLYLDIPVAVKEYYPSGTVMRESAVTLEVSSCGEEAGLRFRNNKERFLREAKMLARFSQVPEIVQVRNFFLANNTAYIVMEYVEGITLKQYVRDKGGKLSLEQTLAILGPVVQAMGKVHKAGIVHRDISPDNIMMLPDGRAKLLDFGAVRDVGAAAVDKNLTKSTEAILKPGYAPIEQYLAHGNLGPWTDVYALCATIFFCLTGQVPPASPERLLGEEVLELEKELPALSAGQRAALERGLSVRAEDRSASMEELYRELLASSESSAEPSPPPPPPPPPPPLEKKHWGLYALAAALALCALLFGLQALRGQQEPPAPAAPEPSPVEEESKLLSGQLGSALTWTLDAEKGLLTVSGTGAMPDFPENSPAPWQEHKGQIKAVQLESGVASVGAGAFAGCEKLSVLELPDTLETIGDCAFGGCALKSLVLPDSVSYVGARAFEGNDKLTSVTVGPDTRLNYDTWEPIFTAEKLTIRGHRYSMAEDYARILGCDFEAIGEKSWDAQGACGEGLTWFLDLESGFLKIDGQGPMWDFQGDGQEEQIEGRELPPWAKYRGRIFALSLGDEVSSIGQYAFKGCDNLADVAFGSSLERIGSRAFTGSGVDQLVLPDSVKEIEHFTIHWCEKLTELRLPEGLERLTENAISECGNLERLFVGQNTVIDESHGLPFTNEDGEGEAVDYPKLRIIGLPGSDAERFATEYNFPFQTGARGLVAEEEGQCGDAVYWFKARETLYLYGSGSTWLYGIDDQERADWALRDWPESWLFYEHPDYYTYREEIEKLVILPGVEALMHGTVDDFPKLRSIDFGTLGTTHFAIQNCPSLEEVHLPDSLTVLGEWGLARNPNLRRVTIENGSDWLGMGLLQDCHSLEEVWFSGKESLGTEDLFDGHNDGKGSVPSKVCFYVKPGSDALRYAQEHGIPYETY